MTHLLENTYNAYNQFLEGSINEYDLINLVEDEIISSELLLSMLEEGFLSSVVLGHHLNNASPSDIYKTNNILHQTSKNPIVKHISDTNHVQNYIKNLNQKHFDISNPKLTKQDLDNHKKELSSAANTFEKLDKTVGLYHTKNIDEHLDKKYGKEINNDFKHVFRDKHEINELNKPINRMKYHKSLNNVRNFIKDRKEMLGKKYLEDKENIEYRDIDKPTRPSKHYKGHEVRGGVINIDQNKFMAKNQKELKDKNENDIKNDTTKNYKETPLTKYMSNKYKNSGDLTAGYVNNLLSHSKYDEESSKINELHKNLHVDAYKGLLRGHRVSDHLHKKILKSSIEYSDAIATGKHIENQLKDENMPKEAKEELERLNKKHKDYLDNVRLNHLKNLKTLHDTVNNGTKYRPTYNI